jgi:DNA polymerase sigma
MSRNELLHYSEKGQIEDLELLFLSKKFDPCQISQGIFKCLESLNENHLETITLLLKQKADLSFRNNKGLTILQFACFKGSAEAVSLILSEKPDLSESDNRGRSHHCIALLNESRDPVDILKLLHESGVSIYTQDMYGDTPLHYAASKGHKASALFLIEKGADVKTCDQFLDTPLHIAFRKDRIEIVEILLPISDLMAKNNQGKTPALEAHGRAVEVLNLFYREKNVNQKQVENGKTSKCFQCKIFTEVFCLTCAGELMGCSKFEQRIKELENSLEICRREKRIIQEKIEEIMKKQEKNNEKQERINENLEKSTGKLKISPVLISSFSKVERKVLVEKLEKDIQEFSELQEKFVNEVKTTYEVLISIIKDCIESTLKKSKVEIFGSLATGLFLPYSDIDLVITNDKYKPASSLLEKIIKPLESLGIVNHTERIYNAKFPLIKVQVFEGNILIKIDITVSEDKHKGKDCVSLVNSFTSKYPEIKPIFLILKQLMHVCGFSEPFKGGMSSYALFLMVISFYQKKFKSKPNSQKSEIFLGFLEFYTEQYNYSSKIVVEYEGWDLRDFKNKSFSDSFIEGSLDIPDPLNPKSNVAHLTDIEKFYVKTIQAILMCARHILFKPNLCSCLDSLNLISKVLYECMFNIHPDNI